MFDIVHIIGRECAENHVTTALDMRPSIPYVWLTINSRDMRTVHTLLGAHVTISQYLDHYVPRHLGGDNSGGKMALHTLPDTQCPHSGCDFDAAITHIVVSWPQILHINPDVRVDPDRVIFDNSIVISDEDGSKVTYELASRILHVNGNHFISQLRFGGLTYVYDDLKYGGKLQPSDDPHLLEVEDKRGSIGYIYNRTSSNHTVRIFCSLHDDPY